MTQDEVNELAEGDAVAIPTELRPTLGTVAIATDNYVTVRWPIAHKQRVDILQRNSPLWRAMVRK